MQLEARLIDDLLDVTRITRGKIELRREAVDAHRLMRDALQIAQRDMTEKQIELVMELGATKHHVWADPVRIQQVLWNLVNNAVKFTKRGGRITIRSSNEGKRLALEVSDTGIGIEPELQGRIFKAFEQGEPSITRQFGGLGLGLTISKTLLDLHGGTISVQSAGKNLGSENGASLGADSNGGKVCARRSSAKCGRKPPLRWKSRISSMWWIPSPEIRPAPCCAIMC